MIKLDLLNQRFGQLVVIERLPSVGEAGRKAAVWLCLCNCGEYSKVKTGDLRSGNTKSCGCQKGKKNGMPMAFKHGLKQHPKYSTWCHIKERCYREKHKNYASYGGRGIRVEEPWLSDSSAFIYWYEAECDGDFSLQVDRIDPNGNYSMENCRLASSKENNNNRTNNRILNYKGIDYTMAELVEKFSVVEYNCFQARLKSGWDIESALKTYPNTKETKFKSIHQALWYRHRNMRDRCNNPKNHNYARYGLRGITVCDEWKDVENFISWSIENGFEPHLSLDRIDNDGPYSPENCRWVSSLVQAGNKGG